MPRIARGILGAAVLSLSGFWVGSSDAQMEFEREPIRYSTAKAVDPVSVLQQELETGKKQLAFDKRHGFLKSVLKALDISPASQMLVFSKTSFQQRRIAPWTPRAIYFNDTAYVGWVPEGDVIEVSAVDPELGAVFYTLRQEAAASPKFVRDQGNCLTCHASSRTQGVPGHLVRSVFPSASGRPHFGSGTYRTTHNSPFEHRWGGWYVTGTHGKQRHMGNVIAKTRERSSLDREAGANVTDLSDRTQTKLYLTPHSDIVALMVLEHQTEMHNLITRAAYEARTALHQGAVMNKVLERPSDFVSESTQRRIDNASEKLVRYMLFCEEELLTDPVRGTSQYAAEFAARGPQDSQGRSLRDLDLKSRMFRHPCSYLIYSEAFRRMPQIVKDRVYGRLGEVLRGEDRDEAFSHLRDKDRTAIREILRETISDLPDGF